MHAATARALTRALATLSDALPSPAARGAAFEWPVRGWPVRHAVAHGLVPATLVALQAAAALWGLAPATAALVWHALAGPDGAVGVAADGAVMAPPP